jgi:hypothetical protein
VVWINLCGDRVPQERVRPARSGATGLVALAGQFRNAVTGVPVRVASERQGSNRPQALEPEAPENRTGEAGSLPTGVRNHPIPQRGLAP